MAALISAVFFDASLVLDAYEMSVTNQITLEAGGDSGATITAGAEGDQTTASPAR